MQWTTHEVSNQVPELLDYNLFSCDSVLVTAIKNSAASWYAPELAALGAALGTRETLQLGQLANQHLPELQTHDRFGNRIDRVDFHPSWHQLLAMQRRASLHALPWSQPRAGAHIARTAAYYLQAQVESGSLCPVTMTFAAIPLLQQEPALFATLKDKLFSTGHDERDLPLPDKASMLVGMGMTEKQGGSDVRSNTTVARPLESAGRGQPYALTGHKWFFSAPMCDAHLVLARTEAGLSCFFVPRWRPDGSKNAILIQRLKDKLGNRSNSSSEVEFQDAYGVMVGEDGRGIPTIIEMANHTRLDCVIGSTGLMRNALVQAIHHARHRHAFGLPLAEQALMQNVLADLALESEAATRLMLRLAQAAEAIDDPVERAWRRVVTPAAKFWICKRALEFTGECMEVWGGNGYVENAPMARMYREAPVNSIWEGSGNVMCLDVLRAIAKEADAFKLLLDALLDIAKEDKGLRELIAELRTDLALPATQQEMQARRFTQRLVLVAQSCLMLQAAPANIADAFISSRLDAESGRVYGTLAAPLAAKEILERAWPL
ncbi:acyl-CoA dehydrogenase [Janthinobacterium sp. Marseille]|nr:isovaleryl-CoA dehydrogenase [Janthinobacterium sp. Marseille]ABR89320.1 acyl-CoA dehydrogenase [Janthinobacterium sp. Marseille]